MIIEIKIPNLGESISYVELSHWLVEDGTQVVKDQEIAEIESDKATITLNAEENGQLKIIAPQGSKLNIGDVVGTIDTSIIQTTKNAPTEVKAQEIEPKAPIIQQKENIESKIQVTPVAEKMIAEHHLNLEEIIRDKIKRISKSDVIEYIESKQNTVKTISRNTIRKDLSPLRKKLAERLVQAKNETAMLTTYNEVDLSDIIHIRKQYGENFQQKYGIKLGFVSFFSKAVAIALKEFPAVNASLDGDAILYHEYVDIGIAVSTDKGLMVPVIRNVETLSIPEVEKQINDLAEKARNRKITIEEMEGGTFTISNGGVFGSLLSSPIINPPQVAILGMHKIQERPVGIEGKIELRPMMYLALSYDHRVIDGKESVSFLVKVKELLENPVNMTIECKDAIERLVGV